MVVELEMVVVMVVVVEVEVEVEVEAGWRAAYTVGSRGITEASQWHHSGSRRL